MKSIQTDLNHMNQLVVEGKMLEAFEMYYDDDVVMQENDAPPTVGKAANRQRELEFLGKVREFRQGDVLQKGVSDNVSFTIWKYDYTHADWGVRNYIQVSVQHWRDGKIVKEQFFYNQ